MSIPLIIYLAGLAESFKCYSQSIFTLMIITLMVSFVVAIFRLADNPEGRNFISYAKEHFGYIKNYFYISLIVFLLNLFIPSKETIYLMVSAKVAEKMVQSSDFKQLYSKSFELLNLKIDEVLENKTSKNKDTK